MLFKNYLKYYLKIVPLITIIILSFVTQSYLYGQTDTWQLFFEAVKKGDIAQTKYLLENKHLEKLKKEAKRELAKSEKNVFNFKLDDLEQQIFDSTVQVNCLNGDDYSKTALMYAVSNKDIKMINLLLSYKPEIDAESEEIIGHPLKTITPFTCAIYNDSIDIVKIFTEYTYFNSTLGSGERTFSSDSLKSYSKYAKKLGKSNIVKYFEDSGFFITEKDMLMGDLTEQKIDRYKKKFGTISQSDVDRVISSRSTFTEKLLLYRNLLSNKSFILYLKKYTDINFTIHHIDKMLQINSYDKILIDQIIFIMDTYNISADIPKLPALPWNKKLLNMLFEKGFNPNNITLGEPHRFFGYDTDYEKYVYAQQIAYNKKEQAKQEELKKAELKAKKAAEKEEKRLAKEAKKAAKLAPI